MNTLCYIIGPYAAYTDENGVLHAERENVSRAVALGSLALTKGMVPVIPHITIGCSALLLGEHGHPDADGIAKWASYGGGNSGLAAFMGGLAYPNGSVTMWGLLREDETMSKGTQIEYDAFRHLAPRATAHARPWAGWRDHFIEAGLEALWQDAGKSDAQFPRWPGDTIDADLGEALLHLQGPLLDRHVENSKRITVMSRALEHIAHMPHGETENKAATFAQDTLDKLRRKP